MTKYIVKSILVIIALLMILLGCGLIGLMGKALTYPFDIVFSGVIGGAWTLSVYDALVKILKELNNDN